MKKKGYYFFKKIYIITLPISNIYFFVICHYEKTKKLSFWITEQKFYFGKTEFRKYIIQHIISHLFCISSINLIHILSMKIFFNNSIHEHLGNISYEIYLYHTFFIYFLRKKIIAVSHDGFYVFFIFFSLYTAKIMRKVNQFLINLLISKKKVMTNHYLKIKNEFV